MTFQGIPEISAFGLTLRSETFSYTTQPPRHNVAHVYTIAIISGPVACFRKTRRPISTLSYRVVAVPTDPRQIEVTILSRATFVTTVRAMSPFGRQTTGA